MFYKPNYCCNCGEKIERIEWYPWTNRRFCEICQLDYQLDDWIKRIFPTLFLLFGIFGLGTYFQGSENTVSGKKSFAKDDLKVIQQPRKLKEKNLSKSKIESKQNAEDEAENKTFENRTETDNAAEPREQNTLPDAESKQIIIAKNPQKNADQFVYYCGAETKKGMPCSRKVKGGGRCWQHIGREALLSAKELKAESKR